MGQMVANDRREVPEEQGATQSWTVLAREWARAIVGTTYVPMAFSDVVTSLQDLTERLLGALSGLSVDTRTASDVGARLVAMGFTGAQSLSQTFDVLGRTLRAAFGRAAPQPSCSRIIELLGALATGYTWALRDHVLNQEEEVKQALSLAWQDLERDLRASRARFRKVFDSSPVGIAISEPDGRIVHINRSLEDILDYPPGELLGRTLSELFAPADQATVEQSYRGLVTDPDSRFRVRFPLRRADGENAWVYLHAAALPDPEQDPRCLLTMVHDVTDLHLLEQRLHHQTLHDLQTGLPNRQYLITHLEKILAQLEPSDVITLMHLDLDGFSAINDGLGHHAGNQLLDVVARRLEGAVANQQAMVARLGADEYAILIKPGDSAPDVGAVAEVINTGLAEPFYIDGIGVAATATIGVVQRRVAGATPEELMRAASTTLRRLHGQGMRQWAAFDPGIDAVDRAKHRLAAEMPGALEMGELSVNYQPVVTLDDPRLVMGVEATLSWQHPQRGVLPHEHCAQAAQRTGAVHAVGEYLLRAAAEQAVCWRESIGDGAPPVVVNLLRSQAQDQDLVARVRAVLKETSLEPGELELRVPVTAIRTAAGDLNGEGGGHAEDNLKVLAELDVRTGLYDFAGSIGGVRCVAELPVRVVRIAQPISEQVANDPSRILSQAAQALVHIVRGAGIDVVAFPVDSAEQAACWPWIGANWAVGALFGQPSPPHDIELRLADI
jgi:diguanylate cyclase (GGDEF)-like protein/PAS domain S-box-containing protein